MFSCSRRTARAPGRPRAIKRSMRVSRTLTRANSAATKKPFARMSKATETIRKSISSIISRGNRVLRNHDTGHDTAWKRMEPSPAWLRIK